MRNTTFFATIKLALQDSSPPVVVRKRFLLRASQLILFAMRISGKEGSQEVFNAGSKKDSRAAAGGEESGI
jgi:hypothetical protein